MYPSPISKLKSRAPNGSDTTTPPSSNPLYDASKSLNKFTGSIKTKSSSVYV